MCSARSGGLSFSATAAKARSLVSRTITPGASHAVVRPI
jgi:hypothetical protein